MGLVKKLKEFLQNAASVCLPFVPPAPTEEQKRLKRIMEKIGSFPEGKQLLDHLAEKNVKVAFSRDPLYAHFTSSQRAENGKWHIIPNTQFILLNPDKSDDTLIALFFHEARHAQQALGGTIRPDKQVSPEEFHWFHQALEADAEADNVLTALRSKINGNALLFDAIKNNSNSVMCLAAEKKYLRDPASLDDGRLKRELFDKWFEQEVYRAFYAENSISICKGPQEDLTASGFSKSPLTIADIEKIGMCGGEKVNYLALPGFLRLDTPHYREAGSKQHRKQLRDLTEEWEKKFLPAQKPATPKTSAPGPGG